MSRCSRFVMWGIVSGSIVAFLLGLAVHSYDDVYDREEEKAAEIYIHATFKAALAAFRFACDRYPTTEEGLAALLSAPDDVKDRWTGPYLEPKDGKLPLDPWKREYRYAQPGIHNPGRYDLSSLGADGRISEDDVTNW